MADSAPRNQQRLQEQAGELGRVKVKWVKGQGLIHKINCTACSDWGGRTYRTGQPNSYTDALARWTLHLAHAHPEADAPCLTRLPEIKAVRKEQRRREREEIAAISAQLKERIERRNVDFAARLEAAGLAEEIVTP